MKLSYSKNFVKQSKKLDPALRSQLVRRMSWFQANPLDPRLRNHRLKGRYKAYRSIDVSGNYRALYLARDDEAIFDVIGSHSQLYG